MDFYEVSRSIKTKESEHDLKNELDELQTMIEKASLHFEKNPSLQLK